MNGEYTDRPTDSPLIRSGQHKKIRRPTIILLLCVFIIAVMSLQSRCLATIEIEGRDVYAVEVGPGAIIYFPSFIQIGLGIEKLI
jgi:hypothetical protein